MSRFLRICFFLAVFACAFSSYGQLSGSYTIGGATPDYVSINAAVTDLTTVGVSGPVIFNIRDGVYAEQLTISSISGTSATNTVTFQSESADSSVVTIQNSSGYVVETTSCNFLKFHQLGFEGPQAGSPSTIFKADFGNFMSITNCWIRAHPTSTLSNDNNAIHFNRSNFPTIENNNIDNGYIGVYVEGSSSFQISQSSLVGNIITDPISRGIFVMWHGNECKVTDNVINGTNNALYGIQLTSVTDSFEVSGNQIEAKSAGIYLANSSGYAADHATVANNFISSPSLVLGDGIRMSGSSNIDVVYNSVNLQSASGNNCYGLKYEGGCSGNNLLNNSFVSINSPEIIFLDAGSSYTALDYSNFFTGGAFSFSLPPNSVSVDPGYTSATDLHITSNALDGLATPFLEVLVDIDNDARNAGTPDIGADEFTPPPLDAGMLLSLPVGCGQPTDITATLKNWGTATINTATIEWEVDGIGQPTYNWSGILVPGAEATIVIGQYPLSLTTGATVKVWSSAPNGASDAAAANDTATMSNVYRGLQGTYTLGGITPDFNTFSEAVTALENGGVCGAVVFDVRTGTYEEQLNLTAITNASTTNTITFQSESGDSTDVHLFMQTPVGYTIQMTNASHFRFNSMTISNDGGSSNNVIRIIDCSDVQFNNNRINGTLSGGSFATEAIVRCSDPGSDVNLTNNHISLGDVGIWALGISSTAPGFLCEGNEITSLTGNAIDVENLNSPQLLRNKIDLSTTNTSTGIDSYNLYGTYIIAYNQVYVSSVANASFGIDLLFNGGYGKVFNNSVILDAGGQSVAHALRVEDSDDVEVTYNTLVTNSTASNHAALFVNQSDSVSVYNNNLCNVGNGIAYSFYPSSGNVSDHNNLYSTGAQVGNASVTLGDFQTNYSQDFNSVSADPQFQSMVVDDLYPQNAALFGMGVVVPSITDDIFGYSRHLTFPDIGAFEQLHPPVADLGIDTTACDSIVLDARNLGSTYLWSTGETSQTITVAASGNIWVQVTNGLGVDSDTVAITISASPIVQLQDTTLCAGDSVVLDAGNSGATFAWSSGDTVSSITVMNPGTYVVDVTDGVGCFATDSAQITVAPLPNVDIGPDSTFCAGDSILLDAGNPGSQFSWSTGDSLQHLMVFSPGLYYVDVQHYCGTFSDTVDILIEAVPTVTIVGDSSICFGDTVYLQAMGANAYLWSNGSASSNLSFPVFSDSIVSVVGTSVGGCSDSSQTLVTVLALPNTNISGDTTICEGDTTTLTATGGDTYLWDFGPTTMSVEVSPMSNTTYSVTGYSVDGCELSDSIELIVHPLPTIPTITQNGGDLTSSVTILYQWYDLNGPIAGATNQTYTPIVNGLYYVEVTDGNGCSAISAAYDFQWIGLGEYLELSQIHFYPNPARSGSILTIECTETLDQINLFDQLGRSIPEIVEKKCGDNCVQLKLPSGLGSGLYILSISANSVNKRVYLVVD